MNASKANTRTGPEHSLEDVLRLVAAGRVRFWPTKAQAPLTNKYGFLSKGTKRATAILLKLQTTDFEEPVWLPNPPAECDVYGVQCDGDQWYIKFYVDVDIKPPHDEIVEVVSFHPSTQQMNKTRTVTP